MESFTLLVIITMIPVGILLGGFLYGSYLQYVKGEDVIDE